MKKELWLRLKRYHFSDLAPAQLADRVRAAFGGGDASTQAFASKVARKLGWTRPFALRAIHEYKKFVYLGVVSETSVTPPKVIDQVWHEHLLFTRAYRDFCRDVLGRDFDHNPELVQSKRQTELFQVQYAETLALYQSEFAQRPPAEIWGTPKFAAGAPKAKPRAPRRTSTDATSGTSGDASYETDPLHTFFRGDGGASDSPGAFETGGGGGFSGGGSHGSWSGPSDGDGTAGHGGDSSSGSDGGSSGGDSGGSGCSSSCGGGGD